MDDIMIFRNFHSGDEGRWVRLAMMSGRDNPSFLFDISWNSNGIRRAVREKNGTK